MAINIIKLDQEISCASRDTSVGIKIATLLEINNRGTYLTIIPAGESVNPHYHQFGEEEYHIISGRGIIRFLPIQNLKKDLQPSCRQIEGKTSFVIPPNVIHQLINNGTEPLTLLFSCPLSHLKEDRIIVENFGS